MFPHLSVNRALLMIAVGVTCLSAPVEVGRAESVQYLNSGKILPSDLPFSEAVRVSDTLYLSGQVGIVPGTMKLATGGLKGETRQAMENIKATLVAHDYSMNDVIKCVIMLADISQWSDFNDVYETYFRDPYPARSAFGADGLAIGAQVEIECIAVRDSHKVGSTARTGAEDLANAYVAATFEGNAAALRRLFADGATMSGYMDGQPMIGSPEPFFQQMESAPSLKSIGAPYEATIEDLNVAGNIASVTISETGFGDKNFVNYLHMLRIDGQWLIINKTFENF